jgi:uracil-DNA glycosylase
MTAPEQRTPMESWPHLIQRLEGCTKCHGDKLLHPKAKPLFCSYRGERSDLLFILEAPNLADTEENGYITYDDSTDPTGRFFRKLYIDELGEPIETAAVTNAVLCRPALSRGKYPVSGRLTRNCSEHLRTQVRSLDPLIVVTLGGKALAASRCLDDHGLGSMRNAVGIPTPWLRRTLVPLYHPGLQVRNNVRTGRGADQQRQDWRGLRVLLSDARLRRRAAGP